MPPFDVTPGIKNLLGVWGAITGSAMEFLPTQQLYSAIYNAQVDAGIAPGGFTIRDVNTLRTMANGWRNSITTMRTAEGHTSVNAVIAEAPWSRPLWQRNATGPNLEIHYQYLRTTEEGTGAQWLTVPTDELGVLNTVDQVRAAVDQHASDVTAGGGSPPLEEGEDFAGIGDILVVAV